MGETYNLYQPGVPFGDIELTNSTGSGFISRSRSVSYTATASGLHAFTVLPLPGAKIEAGTTVTLTKDLVVSVPPEQNLSTVTMGQNAQFNLSLTANTTSTINIDNISVVPLRPLRYTLTGSGITPMAGVVTGSSTSITVRPLSSGTYTLVLDPEDEALVTARVSLAGISSQAIAVGTDQPLSLPRGQLVKLDFAASQNQILGFALTNITTDLASATPQSFSLTLRNDAGLTVFTGECIGTAGVASGCSSVKPIQIAVTGNYSLLVTPQFVSTITATAVLSQAVNADLTVNTVGISTSTLKAGQPVTGTFEVTPTTQHWFGLQTYSAGGNASDVSLFQGTQAIVTASVSSAQTVFAITPSASMRTLRYIITPPNRAASIAVAPQFYVPLSLALTPGTPLTVNAVFRERPVSVDFTSAAAQGFNLAVGTVSPSATSCVFSISDSGGLIRSDRQNCSQLQIPMDSPPANGIYNLRFEPPAQGVVSATLAVSPNRIEPVSLNVSKPVTTSLTAQRVILQFAGTAGQTYSARLSGMTQSDPSGNWTVQMRSPAGAILSSTTGSLSTAQIVMNAAPSTGTYSVIVTPNPRSTISFSALVTAAAESTVIVDGSAVNLATSLSGQVLRMNFAATVGDNLAIALTDQVFSPTTAWIIQPKILSPSGALIPFTLEGSAPRHTIRFGNLPESGVYSLLIAPLDVINTMAMTGLVSKPFVAPLALGTPYPLALTRAGKAGHLTFAGVAGDSRIVAVSGVTTGSVVVQVLDPIGGVIGQVNVANASAGTIELLPLALTGTHTIFVRPTETTNATATISVNPTASFPASIDGSAVDVAATGAGQRINVVFNGSVGQRIAIALTDIVRAPARAENVYISLFEPDGTSFTIPGGSGYGGQVAFQMTPTQTDLYVRLQYFPWISATLRKTGLYRLEISPLPDVQMSSAKVLLSTQKPYTVTTIPSSVALATTRAGQGADVTIPGTIGQRLNFAYQPTSNLDGLYQPVFLDPAGNYINVSRMPNNLFVTPLLPVTGIYRLILAPYFPTVSGSLLVTSEPTEALAFGVSTPLNLTSTGQSVRYTFNAVAGKEFAFTLTGGTAGGSVDFYMVGPQGLITYGSQRVENGLFDYLPTESGAYVIAVRQRDAANITANVLLSDSVEADLGINSRLSFNTALPGRNIIFRSPSVPEVLPYGRAYQVRLEGLTTGVYVNVKVGATDQLNFYAPPGTTVSDPIYIYTGGVISVRVDPPTTAISSGTVAITEAQIQGAVAVDGTAQGITTAFTNQERLFTFTATQGQSITASVTGLSSAFNSTGIKISRSSPGGSGNGSTIPVVDGNARLVFPLLTESGTYTLKIASPNDELLTGQVRLTRQSSANVTVDAAPIAFQTTAANPQGAVYLSALANQPLTLSFTGLTPAPSALTPLRVEVHDSYGQLVESRDVIAAGTAFTLAETADTLYTVLLLPATGTISASITASSTPTLPITMNSTTTVALDRPGQARRYRFTTTGDERVSLAFANTQISGAVGDLDVRIVDANGFVNSALSRTVPAGAVSVLDLQINYGSPQELFVELDAPSYSTVTTTMTLSREIQVSATVGTPLTLSTTLPGQRIRVTVPNEMYENYRFSVYGTTVSGGGSALVALNLPSVEPELQSQSITSSTNASFNLYTSYYNTHELLIDPGGLSTATVSVAVTKDQTVELAKNASSQAVATAIAGQNLRLNLNNGMNGVPYQLKIASVNGGGTFTLLNGSQQAVATAALSTGVPATVNIPTDWSGGSYRALVQPIAGQSLSFAIEWLSPQVTINASATALTMPIFASREYGLNVIAGQQVRVAFDNMVGGYLSFRVLKPNREYLGTQPYGTTYYAYQPSGSVLLPALPESGLYTLEIFANAATSANLELLVDSFSPITVDGATTSGSTVNRRGVRFEFPSVTGEIRNFALSAIDPAPSPANPLTVSYYDLEGRSQGSQLVTTGTAFEDTLPGNNSDPYRVVVTSTNTLTTFTASASRDLNATLIIPSSTVRATTHIGQRATYSFAGTSGEPVNIAFTAISIAGNVGPAIARVTNNAGDIYYKNFTLVSGVDNVFAFTPSATGTFKIFLDPALGTTFSSTLSISQLERTPLTLGSGQTVATIMPGQNIGYTFNAVTGARMGLALRNVSVSGTPTVGDLRVVTPSKSNLVSTTYTAGSDTVLNLPALTESGVYTVVFDPREAAIFSGTLTVSNDVAGTLTKPGVTTLATTVTGQNLRYTFPGTANEFVSFEFTSTAITGGTGNATARVLRSNGTQVATVNLVAGAPALLAPKLPATETYSLEIDPPGVATISTSAAFSSDLSAALAANTAATAITTTAGQNVRYTFSGSSGGNLGLSITGVTISGSALTGTISVLKPDDTVQQTQTLTSGASNVFNLTNLPVGGTYKVFIDPPLGATLSANLLVSSEVTGTANINASPATVATTLVGQNVRYALNGTAGEVYQLRLTGTTFTGASGSGTVTVLKPDNTNLVSQTFDAGITKAITLPAIPTTGTYRIFLDPPTTATLGMNLQVRYEKTGALPTNGTATAVTTATLQNARYTFTGAVGQNLGLGVTAVSITGATGNNAISVFAPSGASVATSSIATGATTAVNLVALTEAGTYEVFVDPPSTATSEFTLTLTQDKTGTLTKNGTPLAASTTRAGENLRLALAGVAGEAYSLRLTGIALTGATGNGNITVLRPDGTTLTTTTFTNAVDKTVAIAALPTTGTYTVLIDPPSSATVALNVEWLYETTGTLALTGVTSNLTLGVAQNARYSFTLASAGSYGLGIGAVTLTGATTATKVTVLRTDGSQVATVNVAAGSAGSLNLANLAAGAYSVLVDPPDAASATSSLTLSPDKTGTITISGATVAISTQFAGQNGRYTFSGTAAQLLRVTLTAVTITGGTGSASVTVLNPDGSTLSTKTFTANTTLDVAALPTTGTYTLLIDPPTVATISLSAALGPR